MSAGGNDYRTRRHSRAFVNPDRVRSSIAGELRGASGHEHLGAELLRLREGASGELLAGDAGRKAEIVLDPRAGSCLPARRIRLDHQHIEALGRAVHRGCEPAGPAPTITTSRRCVRFDALIETQTLGDLLVAGVTEDRIATANQHRDIVGRDVKTIQQRLDVLVAVEIDGT